MPRFTRRSKATDAVDNTQGSSFDPLLSLQPSPEIRSANDLSGAPIPPLKPPTAVPCRQPLSQPPRLNRLRRGRVLVIGPITDHRETRGSSKENRDGNLGRDGESERREGIEELATGRRASFLPDRGDTHSTQGASTVLLDHNAFNFNNVESDVEDEGEWHDELTHKEPAGHPTRASEAKVLERGSWGEDSISSPGPSSQNTGRSGDTVLDGDDSSPGAGSSLVHSAIMTMRWPAETNMDFRDGRTRIRLMSQPTIVQLVLQDAIENMHAFLLFRHAFPDPDLVVEGAKAALTRAARARFPGAARVHERLLSDEEYILNMTVIPRARIPIIRNSVKDRCSAMVAAEYMALDPLINIADLVAKEMENYNYIYPVSRFGRSMKDRLLRRSQPYRNERIINVIHNMYFTGGVSSFARRFNNMFVRFCDDQGAMIPVVPDAMVALVATAVYSAVFDWRNGKKEPVDFTTGAYLDVYDGNINTLKNMRLNHPSKYHTMMADIYAKVSSTATSSTAVEIADIPIGELDG